MNPKKLTNLIGRILISAIFISAIPSKIIDFDKNVELIISKNIPYFIAPFLLVSAIICLFFGSMLFISGIKQRAGAILLLIFIVPTTFIFHFFPFEIKPVLMNSSLAGGLILGLNTVKVESLKYQFNEQKRK